MSAIKRYIEELAEKLGKEFDEITDADILLDIQNKENLNEMDIKSS
jgi:ribosome-associated translation inhibitor RaiA